MSAYVLEMQTRLDGELGVESVAQILVSRNGERVSFESLPPAVADRVSKLAQENGLRERWRGVWE